MPLQGRALWHSNLWRTATFMAPSGCLGHITGRRWEAGVIMEVGEQVKAKGSSACPNWAMGVARLLFFKRVNHGWQTPPCSLMGAWLLPACSQVSQEF